MTEYDYHDKKRIAELEENIKGKENEFRYFSNSFRKKISELKEQIEKMKCCENCKHYYNQNGDTWCELPKDVDCTDFDNWELEE